MGTSLSTSEAPACVPAAQVGAPGDRDFQVAIAIAILLLAAALRVPGLFTSLWIDEAGSLAKAGAPDFLAAVRQYDHPPLYFWLLRVGLRFTDAFAGLRLFSLLAGVGTVALLLYAWPAGTPHVARWLSALIVAVLPECVFHSSELRQYALLILALTAATIFHLRLAAKPRDRFAEFGVAGSLAVAACTHLLTIFFIAGLAAVLAWEHRRAGWRLLARRLALLLPGALFFVFFKAWFLSGTVKTPADWWMPPLSWAHLTGVTSTLVGWDRIGWMADAFSRHLPGTGILVRGGAALALAAMALGVLNPRSSGAARGLLALGLLYLGGIVAYSWLVVSLLWPRILLPGLPPLAAAVALGISEHRQPPARNLAVGGVLFLALLLAGQQFRLAGQPTEDLASVSATLRYHCRPGDVLILVGGVEVGVRPYWPGFADCDPLLCGDIAPDSAARSRLDARLQPHGPHERVYVLSRADEYLQKHPAMLGNVVTAITRSGAAEIRSWQFGTYRIDGFAWPAPETSKSAGSADGNRSP